MALSCSVTPQLKRFCDTQPAIAPVSASWRRLTAVLTLLIGTLMSWPALAAEESQPLAIDAGPISVLPRLKIAELYNDNIYLQHSQPVDSLISVLSPGVELQALDRNNLYSLAYRLDSGSYASAHALDYNDQDVLGKAHLEMNQHNSVELQGHYEAGHEEPGTGVLQGPQVSLQDSPVQFDRSTAALGYQLGNRESAGRLGIKVSGGQTEYTNYRDITRLRDRRNLQGEVNFYWRLGGRTGLVVDVLHNHTDYLEDPSPTEDAKGSKDSDYDRYLMGLSWEASNLTKATVKIGWAEKRFDSASREDFSGLSGQLLLDWAVQPYSRLRLAVERSAEESYGRGDFIDAQSATLTWAHDWNPKVTSKIAYGWNRDVYENDPAGRKDTIGNASLALDYAWREWLHTEIGWQYRNKDSTLDDYSFTRNLASISLSIGL